LSKEAFNNVTAVFLIRMFWAFRTFHQQAKMKKP
jgi:hypothetical protein